MSPVGETEIEARKAIDRLLEAAGWIVQDMGDLNPAAGLGVAVREFPTASGPADYLLYVDRRAIGTIEAKRVGSTLSGFESQGDRYADGFRKTAAQRRLPAWGDPLPFHYLSTGAESFFINRRDPVVRPRRVFAFHRPETLQRWAGEEHTFRGRLRTLPPMDTTDLRTIQVAAVQGLEASLRDDHPRALVAMTMGSGKTVAAIVEAYRLLAYGGANRLLFLVDRRNLGKQAADEFRSWVTPDGRKFGELYGVQLLDSNTISASANVVVTTIQRLYSILRGDQDFDDQLEDESLFDHPPSDSERVEVRYQPALPIETFDLIFTDECHRSIYGTWGTVLDYFDAFLVGLTATPTKFTYGYFNGNVVVEYSHEQSVIDGINVPYIVYRIKTRIGEEGSAVEARETVQLRDRITRGVRWKELDDELTYEPEKLDRAVVAPDQLRTVIRAFRDHLFFDIFPGRSEVPKTVVFCKNDVHAEDVVDVIRREFGKGSDFCRKITYRAEGNSLQNIQDFRTDPAFRIAVSVDQIATGTDIRSIECLLFLRMVSSVGFFEQMKGRGVRTISADDLKAITYDATSKDHFMIVDAVGVTDDDKSWSVSRPLDTKPTIKLGQLLRDIAMGSTDPDTISSLGARLLRLDKRLDDIERQRIAAATGGRQLHDLAADLIRATDPVGVLAKAKESLADDKEPTVEQLEAAAQSMAAEAVAPLLSAVVRRAIEEAQTVADQLIDVASRDELLYAGPANTDAARTTIETFESFIADHHDEYVALAAYYSQPASTRPRYEDIKELAEAIKHPPVNLTPVKVWAAYQMLDSSKVRRSGGRVLTDLVSLLRFATHHDDELVPFGDLVQARFADWLAQQEELRGRPFGVEQRRWLSMIVEHIIGSAEITPDDFDLDPFIQNGGLGGAYAMFGTDLSVILSELNVALVPE